MKQVNSTITWQAMASDVLLIIACQAAGPQAVNHWDTYLILKLSHVCRHWRHTIISFPSLWNKIYIPRRNLTFFNLLLTRSADYPLEVWIVMDAYFHSAVDLNSRGYDLISSHIHRIRSFTFWVISPGHTLLEVTDFQLYVDPILSLFKKSAPMLVSFVIDGYDVQVPEMFLEDVAPNLKQLEVSGSYMTVSYKMPIFRRVTHLCLSNVQGFTSLHQLIGMLESTSKENLKVLKLGPLYGLRPPSPNSDIQDPNARHIHIQFPHLEVLYLDLQPGVLMAVLDRITTPPDVDWTINCSSALSDPILDITPLLSFLGNVRTGPYLLIDWFFTGQIRLRFAQGSSSPPNIILRMGLPRKPESIHQVHSLFTSLYLSQVCFCEIDTEKLSKKDEYIEAYCNMFGSPLHHFHQLERLIIRCNNNQVLHQFATQLQPTSTPTNIFTLPCPLLSDLSIGLFDYNDTDDTKLVGVLMNRKEAGRVLKNLHVGVVGSHVEEHNTLRKILEKFKLAENVTVDGVVSDNPGFTRKF